LNLSESNYADSLGISQFDIQGSSLVPHARTSSADGDEQPAFFTQMDSSFFDLLSDDQFYQQYAPNQEPPPLFGSTMWTSSPRNSSSSGNLIESTASNSSVEWGNISIPAQPSPFNNSGISDPCHCLGTTTSFLEAVSVEIVRANLKSVPKTLHLTRRVLAQFKKLIECKRCGDMSDFLMLLILLSQKISGAFETTIVLLTEQYNKTRADGQQGAHEDPF
jgi:hypothetical protein